MFIHIHNKLIILLESLIIFIIEGILMNINQLYAFTAVYETGNFSESARKLKLTQSAITQLIHGLEKDLDTLLFIRSKRPITPTQNGKMYYD